MDLTGPRQSTDFPGGSSGKELACQHRKQERRGFSPCVGTISWRRARQPIPALVPGESRGQRSLVGCSPWGRTESRHELKRISTQTQYPELHPTLCCQLPNPQVEAKEGRESESCSVMSDSLQPHIQSMEFSRLEYWSG